MEACPKCHFALAPEALECPACGVILAKLKALSGLQRQVGAVPQPLAAPPPPAAISNPYAPPVAQVEAPPAPLPTPVSAPPQDVITRPTLEALATMRPWMRFLGICGVIINTMTLLAALGLLFWSSGKPEVMPVALVYLVAAAVGFSILAPMNRSSAALSTLSAQGASGCLETFAVEQATFWRRLGVLCIVYLAIIVAGVGVAFVAGAFLAGR